MPEDEDVKKGRKVFDSSEMMCRMNPNECNMIVSKELCKGEKNPVKCTQGASLQRLDIKKCQSSCESKREKYF